MTCLNENTIVEYLEGLLDEPAAEEAEQHLDACFVCRRLIVEVAATLLDSARTATPAPSDAVVTRVTQILARRRTPAAEADPSGTEGSAATVGAVPDILPEIPGRYRDRGIRGRGGQARVLVAWDEYMGREVALKQLRPVDKPLVDASVRDRLRQTAENATRFLREVRITGQLSHPSIIPVHEVGRRDDGTLYYTMPLLQGRTLKEALQDCETLGDRLGLLGHFVDLCHGVAYAHSRGVIHRDLKPANVMIGEYGETILLDWGLATFARQDADGEDERPVLEDPLALESGPPTPSGVSLGTPSYMSPEQAAGHIHQVDHRSDIWGLGAILYEILTGEPPHTGPSALQIIIAVATRPVVPVAERCAAVPTALCAAANRALQVDRADRYDNARDLAAEVSAFLTATREADTDRAPAPDAPGAGAGPWWPVALGGVGLLALGLVVGLVVSRGGGPKPAPNRSKARARTPAAEQAARLSLARGHARRALALAAQKRWLEARVHAAAALRWHPTAARPKGSGHDPALPLAKLRRLLADPPAGPLRRWRWRARGCKPGPQAAVVLLADGQHGATGCGDGRLEVWRLADGVTTRRTASHGVAIHRLVRGPGGRLAAGTADGIVALYHPDGRLHRTLHGHRGMVLAVAFSPDGKLLATSAQDTTLRLWSLATNQLLQTKPQPEPLAALQFAPGGKLLKGLTLGRMPKGWHLGPRHTLAAHRSKGPESLGQRKPRPALASAPSAGWKVEGDDSGTLSWGVKPNLDTVVSAVRGHRAPIVGVTIGPKVQVLYSVDRGGTRQAWAVSRRVAPATRVQRSTSPTLRSAQQDAGMLLEGFRLRPLPLPPGGSPKVAP